MATTWCKCKCHRPGVLWRPYPNAADPVESLAACELCALLHCGVWTVYKKPRVTKRWKDPEEPK